MKTLLSLGCASLLIGSTAIAATVAQYEFDGTGTAAVGSTVADSTGNHNGTVEGGPLEYGTDPVMGSFLHFTADGTNVTGVGNRVVVPGAADLSFSIYDTYTIEVIFRTTQTGTNGVLISKGCDVSNPDSQYWIRHQGNGLLRGLIEGADNTTEDSATSTTTIADGQWHHVALVFDGTLTPKALNIYVDGVWNGRDTSVGTAGVIGGVDTDPLIFGEFATLVGNRSFAGDIAAARLSNTALTPSEFLAEGFTRILNLTPADGTSFLPAGTVAGFTVKSPSTGVASTNIHAVLNGTDISGQLTITGTESDWNVTLPALSANEMYTLAISVADKEARLVTAETTFNTFVNGIVFIEGEDYNFDSGKYIDNPALSSTPAANNYLDRLGVEGIDFHQTNTPALVQYRIGDQVGTSVTLDTLRQAYTDAQATDPGVADYTAQDNANTEWLNYTRTFAADTYRVYLRAAKGNTLPFVVRLDQVTTGSTSASQVTSPIGSFRGATAGSTAAYEFAPLTDALGNEIALSLSGTTTLRLTMMSGGSGLLLNYLMFVPISGTQAPFLASLSPAPEAGNEPATSTVQAVIRNADTQVNTATIKLQFDGTSVTPAITPTSLGANVTYTPSLLSTGWHVAKLVFSDTAATSFTNQWRFYVANPAVRGYWKFDEQTAGSTASTNAGAILDASGNARNGTASTTGIQYVQGSSKYGNTTALRLGTGADRVVVPDAAGNFTFTNSFTFEAVIRSTTATTAGAILAKNGTGDGEGEYWWRAPGNAAGAQRLGMNTVFLTGTNVLNDGQWHHLAVVYDHAAAEIRTYVDYVQEGSATLTLDRPIGRPADLQIGGFIGTTTSEFDGDIDFIRISEGALTTAEFIQAGAAPVALVNVVRLGSTISFGFVTEAGRSYVVESTAELGGSWTTGETITGDGSLKTVSYTIGGNPRLFRVRSE